LAIYSAEELILLGSLKLKCPQRTDVPHSSSFIIFPPHVDVTRGTWNRTLAACHSMPLVIASSFIATLPPLDADADDNPTMKAFSTLVLGAVLLASQNHAAKAFSPSARSKVLNDLKEMRMTGAGGAASPDYYVEGGESHDIRCRFPLHS